ncbi:MAG: glycosyltransferase [Myxococcota bacterium]
MPHRILYVIGALGTGGAERQLLELTAGLDRRRYEPLVCALDVGHEYAAAFAERGVPVVEFPRRGSLDWQRLTALRSRIRSEQPALIHAFLASPALYARLACIGLRSRPPVIVSERTVLPRPAYVRVADWLLAHRSACFLANADAVRESLLDAVWPQQPRVEVIPNGFDLSPFERGPTRTELRARLGWGEETIALCVGRLTDAKDFPTLLDAFAKLDRPNLRLVIAGEGEKRSEIEQRIRSQDLRVTLLGLRTDVPDLLRAADLFVLASKVEGFPNVIGEALAAGLPVAATSAGGVPEVVRAGVDGCVVPIGDSSALADAVEFLLDDPTLAREMASRGATRVREEFSLEAMIDRTQAVYSELLAEPSRR